MNLFLFTPGVYWSAHWAQQKTPIDKKDQLSFALWKQFTRRTLKKFKFKFNFNIIIELELPNVPSNDQLFDPSYNPCNCNLTLNLCDLNCCCDSDCTSADINAFSVTCPITRSVVSEEIDEYYCNDIYNQPKLNESSWFPILCIHVKDFICEPKIKGKFFFYYI